MNRAPALPFLGAFVFLSACVTINVYFPAAAAEKAADKVIDEVWGNKAAPPAAPAPADVKSALSHGLVAMLDFVMPAAHAQEPNLDVSSPEIARLTDSMEARFTELEPYLDSGAVGLSADGFMAQRDANAIPLAERNRVRTLVANENADRVALYREMAAENKQPKWESMIRSVFATRWIARAKAGWYYQNPNGDWVQK